MGAGIDQAALFHGAVVGVLHGRLPHLVQDVDVADTHRLEARLVVDRHVFNGSADALEDATDDVGHDDLARPVLDRNLDRFVAVGTRSAGNRQDSRRHDPGDSSLYISTHNVTPFVYERWRIHCRCMRSACQSPDIGSVASHGTVLLFVEFPGGSRGQDLQPATPGGSLAVARQRISGGAS